MRRPVLPLLTASLFLAGCNPYMAAIGAVSQSYDVATDERSLSTQASDTKIEAEIGAQLLASSVTGTERITVYCRQGVVVLAGVVPPGSAAGGAAVDIARGEPGVRRVETFFVLAEPSKARDVEIEAKVKAVLVADPNLVAGRVDVGVWAGHVILVGVVSDYTQAQRFSDDAGSASGVASVRSYIQTESQP
ncbi:MAG: BON domain-containing protein [Candidatus Binatia bacterium]